MLVILIGKSGSGKDSILHELIENEGYSLIVSTTTRPIRDGEVDGVDYHFVTNEVFDTMIAEDKFLEHRSYETLVGGNHEVWRYGTPKTPLNKDKDYAIVLDMPSTQDFLNYYGRSNCAVIFVDAPLELREERAKQRGSFDMTEWQRRIPRDDEQFNNVAVSLVANYRVFNTGTLQRAVNRVLAYIAGLSN